MQWLHNIVIGNITRFLRVKSQAFFLIYPIPSVVMAGKDSSRIK